MLYKKINVELIVVADEAETVVADLNDALDRLEEKHTLFGGGIETVPVEHRGRDRHSRIRSPRVRRSLALSGLHGTALLWPSAQSSNLNRPGEENGTLQFERPFDR
jgi:hypothetical protein